jgi:4-amino-4-deoxy-L-arabinose transferase-like glycosyltransferase
MEAGGLVPHPARDGWRARAAPRVRDLPKRNGGRALFAVLCAVLALGLGLRLYYAIHTANPTPDSHGYALIAQSLYEDQKFGQPGDFRNIAAQEPSNYSPGLPLLVSAIYYVTGGVHPLGARLVLSLLAWLALPLAYLLGRRLGGPVVGVVAALPLSFYPILVEYNGMFMTEPLAVTGLTASVLALLWAGDQRRARAWLVPGLLLGFTALVRPEYLVFGAVFAILALVRAWRDSGPRPGLAAAALVVVAFAVPILPWTIRNLIVLDRLVPLSTGGGKALFIGTYLPGNGNNDETKLALFERPSVQRFVRRAHPGYTPSQYHTIYLDEVLRHIAHDHYPDLETDAALAKMGRHNLSRYFSEEPGSYLKMFGHKILRMWKKGAGGPGLPVMQYHRWLYPHRALVLLGFAGIVLLAFRRRWEAVVIGSLVIGVTLIGAVLLPSPRRTLIVLPLVFATAALTLTWAATRALALARDHGILRSRRAES